MRCIQDLWVISEIIYLIIVLHFKFQLQTCSFLISATVALKSIQTETSSQIPPKKPWTSLKNYSSGYFHGIVQRLRTRGLGSITDLQVSITVKKKKKREGDHICHGPNSNALRINDIMSVKRLELLGKKTLHKYKVVLIFRLSPQCETCFLWLMRSPAVW